MKRNSFYCGVIGLFIPFVLAAQHSADPIDTSLHLQMSPRYPEAYTFFQGDLMYLSPEKSGGNLAMGRQLHDWLGVGGHFHWFALDENNSQLGLGLTYRLKHRFLELRADAGALIAFNKEDANCRYITDPWVNPYFNVSAGLILLRHFRLGTRFTYTPPTVSATAITPCPSVTSFQDEVTLGRDPLLFPYIGFTIPFQDDRYPLLLRPAGLPDSGLVNADSYFFYAADWTVPEFSIYSGGFDRAYLSMAAGVQFRDWFGLGIQYDLVKLDAFPRERTEDVYYEGLGLTYRFTFKRFLELRGTAGTLTKFKYTTYNPSVPCSHQSHLKLNPYFSGWAGITVFKHFRIGAFMSYIPPGIELESSCYFSFEDITEVTTEKLAGNLHIFPSIGFVIR